MSELPISLEPASTFARPVLLPPRLTVMVAPGHLVVYWVATAFTSAARAVEPLAVAVTLLELKHARDFLAHPLAVLAALGGARVAVVAPPHVGNKVRAGTALPD